MAQFKTGDKVRLVRDIEFYEGTAFIGDEAVVIDSTATEARVLVERYGKTWVDNDELRLIPAPTTPQPQPETEAARIRASLSVAELLHLEKFNCDPHSVAVTPSADALEVKGLVKWGWNTGRVVTPLGHAVLKAAGNAVTVAKPAPVETEATVGGEGEDDVLIDERVTSDILIRITKIFVSKERWEALQAELADLRQRLAAAEATADGLRAALEFYANGDNWREHWHAAWEYGYSAIMNDEGRRARAALAALAGETRWRSR